MGVVTLPTTFADNTVPTAAQFNGDFQAITAELNGGLNAANVDQTVIPTLAGSQTFTNKTYQTPIITGWDGWITDTDTWVYVGVGQFKIVGKDVRARFPKGTRLYFVNSTAKYALVAATPTLSGSDTLVTIAGDNGGTVLTNAAITAPFYSYMANPQGYPQSFTYQPVISGSGGSAGTYAATFYVNSFNVVENRCHFSLNCMITNVGSWSGDIRVALPIAAGAAEQIFGYVTVGNTVWNGAFLGPFGPTNGQAYGVFVKALFATNVQWSDVTANVAVVINGEYYF